jgi:ABC-2 type transport system ATP-binding protein
VPLTKFEKTETRGDPGLADGPGEPPAILARGLRKSYGTSSKGGGSAGTVEAVRGLDLEVPVGEFFGFLGPNGAGKSTTIKILCTLLSPTGGEARVAGFDVVRERTQVRRHIGLVFQDPTLDDYLSAEQNLRFHAEIYGMPRAAVPTRIDAVLALVGLAERRRDPVATFSGGMKRRLEIARGLMHSPRVLFLDEPTIGLDPESRASLWRYVDELRHQEKITIFLTTHYMDEAERCDRIAIVDRGTIVALDTPSALKASIGHDRVQLETADPRAAAALLRERLAVDADVVRTADGPVTEVRVVGGEAFVPRLFDLGASDGLSVSAVRVLRPSLDDVFLAYTGNRLTDAEAAARGAGRGRFGRPGGPPGGGRAGGPWGGPGRGRR